MDDFGPDDFSLDDLLALPWEDPAAPPPQSPPRFSSGVNLTPDDFRAPQEIQKLFQKNLQQLYIKRAEEEIAARLKSATTPDAERQKLLARQQNLAKEARDFASNISMNFSAQKSSTGQIYGTISHGSRDIVTYQLRPGPLGRIALSNYVMPLGREDDGGDVAQIAKVLAEAAFTRQEASFPHTIKGSSTDPLLAKATYIDPLTRLPAALQTKIATTRTFGVVTNEGKPVDPILTYENLTARDPITRDFVNKAAFADPTGRPLATRGRGTSQGFDVQAVVERTAGAMLDPKTGRVLNYKGAVANPNDPHQLQKFIKGLQDSNLQEEGLFVDPSTGALIGKPGKSRVVQYDSQGNRIEDLERQVMRFAISPHRMPVGQILSLRDIGIQQDQFVQFAVRTDEWDPTKALAHETKITGREKDVRLYPGKELTTGDWHSVTFRQHEAIQSGSQTFVSYIAEKIGAPGDFRIKGIGIKSGPVARAATGAYGTWAGIEADFVMSPEGIKNTPAVMASVFSAIVREKGEDYARRLGIPVNAQGEIDWRVNLYETRDGRKITTLDMFARAMDRILAPDSDFWQTGPEGQKMLVLPMEVAPTRSGLYTWKSRIRPEIAAEYANLDPSFFRYLERTSQHKQMLYAELVNNALTTSMGPEQFEKEAKKRSGGGPFRAVNMITSEMATEIAQVARRFMETPGDITPAAVRKALSSYKEKIDPSKPFAVDIEFEDGSREHVRFPSVNLLDFLTGETFKVGLTADAGDDDDHGRESLGRYTDYSHKGLSLLTSILNGKARQSDVAEFKEVSARMATASGTWKGLFSYKGEFAVAGPVIGSSSPNFPRNVMALPDALLRNELRGDEEKFQAVKRFLDLNNPTRAEVWREPKMRASQKMGLRFVSLSALKDIDIADDPNLARPVVHQSVMESQEGDFDADAMIATLVGGFRFERDAQGVLQASLYTPGGPRSADTPEQLEAQARRIYDLVGGGLKETRKAEEDFAQWNSPEKIADFLRKKARNLFRGPQGELQGFSAEQIQGAYAMRGTNAIRMGEAYDYFLRTVNALTNFVPGFMPLAYGVYQTFLDNLKAGKGLGKAMALLFQTSAVTGGGIGFDTFGVEDKSKRIKFQEPDIHETGKQMSLQFVTSLAQAEEFTDEGRGGKSWVDFLARNVLDAEQYKKFRAHLPKNRSATLNEMLGALGTSTMGEGFWHTAHKSPLMAMFRAVHSERALRKYEAMGVVPDEATRAWGETGQGLKAMRATMKGKFSSVLDVLEKFGNRIIPPNLALINPARYAGVPVGHQLELKFDQFDPGEVYTNPALGPNNLMPAYIMPEEAEALRGLEAIGRKNPRGARQIARWLGSQSSSPAHPGASYVNPALVSSALGGKYSAGRNYSEEVALQIDPTETSRKQEERGSGIGAGSGGIGGGGSSGIGASANTGSGGGGGRRWSSPEEFDMFKAAKQLAYMLSSVTAAQAEERRRRLYRMTEDQEKTFASVVQRILGSTSEDPSFLSSEIIGGLPHQFLDKDHPAYKALRNIDAARRGKSRQSVGGIQDAFADIQMMVWKRQAAFGGPVEAVQTSALLRDLEETISKTGGRKKAITFDAKTGKYEISELGVKATASPDAKVEKMLGNLGQASLRAAEKISQLTKSGAQLNEQQVKQLKSLETIQGRYETWDQRLRALNEKAAQRPIGMSIEEWERSTEEGKRYARRKSRAEAALSVLDAQLNKDSPLAVPNDKPGFIGRFLRGDQMMTGMQLFYLNRMHRMFLDPALTAAFSGAESESKSRSLVAASGLGFGGMTPSIGAATAFSLMGKAFDREAAATWSPAVRGASSFLMGGAGGLTSILAPTLGSGAIGAYIGSMLTPMAPHQGAIVGGLLAGGVTLGTSIFSRSQYLADNTAHFGISSSKAFEKTTDLLRNPSAGKLLSWLPGALSQGIDQALYGLNNIDFGKSFGWNLNQVAPLFGGVAELVLGDRSKDLNNLLRATPLADLFLPISENKSATEILDIARRGKSLRRIVASGGRPSDLASLSANERNAVMHEVLTGLMGRYGITEEAAGSAALATQRLFGNRISGLSDYEAAIAAQAANVDPLNVASTMAKQFGGTMKDYADFVSSYFIGREGPAGFMKPKGLDQFDIDMNFLGSGFAQALTRMGKGPQEALRYRDAYRRLRKPQREAWERILDRIQDNAVQAGMLGFRIPTTPEEVLNMFLSGDIRGATTAMMSQNNMMQLGNQMMGLGISGGNIDAAMSAIGGMPLNLQIAGGNVMQKLFSGNRNVLSAYGAAIGDTSLISRDPFTGLGLYRQSFGIRNLSGGWMQTPGQTMSMMGMTLPTGRGWGFNAGGDYVYSPLANSMRGWNIQPVGGQLGLQWEAADIGYQSQMASLGASAASVRRSITYTTGRGLARHRNIYAGQELPWQPGVFGSPFREGEGEWYWQDRAERLQRQQQDDSFNQREKNKEMMIRHFMENWEFNRAWTVRQRGWQLEDFGMQAAAMQQQRGWTRADWAFNRQQGERRFGWQIEDINEDIRFASGRERRKLEKQRSRLGVEHQTEISRADEVQKRQEKLWKDEDDRFEKTKKRSEETFETQLERMDMEKRHFLERMGLEDEQAQKEKQWLEERRRIEDELRQLKRSEWIEQQNAQLAAIGAQAGFAAKQKEIQDRMMAMQAEEERNQAKLEQRMDLELRFWDKVSERISDLLYALETVKSSMVPSSPLGGTLAPSGPPKPSTSPGPQKPSGPRAQAVGFQGLVTRPTMFMVAEGGEPEMVTIYPAGAMRSNSYVGNNQAAPPVVHVYIDGEEVSSRVEVSLGRKFYSARKS